MSMRSGGCLKNWVLVAMWVRGSLERAWGICPTTEDGKTLTGQPLPTAMDLRSRRLQLAASYLTIASGGLKRDVSLIEGMGSNDQRIYSREVADQLKQMLASVVTEGTAKKAAIEGYSVGG